jgi:nucleoside-diphosphate-sugar epimerase
VKILLTGAAGFVGRKTAEVLRHAGHDVVATDRRGQADILGDLASREFCAGLPDVHAVVHCAAVQYVSPDLPWVHRSRYFEANNVQATTNLAERYADSAVHLVNVGTSMMYRQDGSALYRVDSAMAAQGVYSSSKLRAHAALAARSQNWATVIPCIIGGIGREGLFRGFVSSILKRGAVAVPGGAAHPVHMVHVDDVASLLKTVVETGARGFINAGAPDPLSITQWVHHIADEIGVPKPKVIRLPLPPLRMASRLSAYRLLAREQLLMLEHPHVLDISASLALGWSPRFDNADIARSIGSYIAGSRRA